MGLREVPGDSASTEAGGKDQFRVDDEGQALVIRADFEAYFATGEQEAAVDLADSAGVVLIDIRLPMAHFAGRCVEDQVARPVDANARGAGKGKANGCRIRPWRDYPIILNLLRFPIDHKIHAGKYRSITRAA